MDTKLLISANKTISVQEEGDDVHILINGVQKKFTDSNPTNAEKKNIAHEEKRSFYKEFLSSHFENLIILSGAGTSVEWGGKTMTELWNCVEKEFTKPELEKFCKAIGYISEDKDFSTLTPKEKDLERLLSRANIAKEFINEYKKTPISIAELIKKAETVIQTNCNFKISSDAPHEQFLNKLTNRKLKDPRVKIFTLNYDTLFEQASVGGNFTVIDGFSFSTPRTLSGRNFDFDIVYREKTRIREEESFVPKVFHLYKPHGSINWELKDGLVVFNDNTTNPLIIYPKDSKYENSYEQPFFEMMSRFQQNLRNDNVLLICVGFSFNDKHIVTAIQEAVAQNPSFRLLIINRTIREDSFGWFIEKAKKQYNVTIVSEGFDDFVKNYPSSPVYSQKPLFQSTAHEKPAI